MVDRKDLRPRTHRAGLLASIIAVISLAVTVLSDDHNAGFGHTIAYREQMFLFVIASLLLAVQAIPYLVHRVARPIHHEADPATIPKRAASD
jgi:hypothetical protein